MQVPTNAHPSRWRYRGHRLSDDYRCDSSPMSLSADVSIRRINVTNGITFKAAGVYRIDQCEFTQYVTFARTAWNGRRNTQISLRFVLGSLWRPITGLFAQGPFISGRKEKTVCNFPLFQPWLERSPRGNEYRPSGWLRQKAVTCKY